MELICRIEEQQPLRTEQYTDRRSGQPAQMAKMGFKLASGAATFYAEMIGERATRQGTLNREYYYHVSLRARRNEWQGQDGQTHYSNELTIESIAPL